jgi:hypothetical protein
MDLKYWGNGHPISFAPVGDLKLDKKSGSVVLPTDTRQRSYLHCCSAFVRGVAVFQKGPLESTFTAVAIVVLLLASPVIGIELGRLLSPMLR